MIGFQENSFSKSFQDDFYRRASTGTLSKSGKAKNFPKKDICLLGDVTVGKSFIFEKFTGKKGDSDINAAETQMTLTYSEHGNIHWKYLAAKFWDIKPYPYEAILKDKISNCHLIIIVYSSQNRESLESIENYWIPAYLSEKIPKIFIRNTRYIIS
ncbi:unnamed protein product [Dimorphilus gyrociliatus]|uniref:Uncharacterized protein n=1 Tax=Dimorphilus gyrociliatus TaxID=2664684 RepID=A0A7I8W9Z0_9ANNE|nr:unnamed protein product [Dimorphilus gyrociliatus]